MDNHHPIPGRDGGARSGGGAGRRILDEAGGILCDHGYMKGKSRRLRQWKAA